MDTKNKREKVLINSDDNVNNAYYEKLGDIANGKKYKRPNKILKILIIFIVTILSLSAVLFLIFKVFAEPIIDSVVNDDKFYCGTIVSGVDIGGKTFEEAKEIVSEKESSIKPNDNVNINVIYEDKIVNLTIDDFNIIYDTDDILNEAYNLYRSGNKFIRYFKIKNLQKEPAYYEISASIDKSDISGSVQKVSEEFNVPMVESKVSGFDAKSASKFTYEEGHDGLELNKDKLYADIINMLNSDAKTGNINAEINIVKNNVSIDDVKKRTVLIGKFSTVSTNNANANYNMNLALSFINGKIIEPSEVFSFNDSVGDTNSARDGYKMAGAISGGKSVQEYGGGICQAASTIYGAAIRANMTIVERHNHQWKSTYVDYGLDATVYEPSLDFRFRNDSDYPIYICSYMEGTKLVCEIYGFQPDWYDYIEPESRVTETIPQPATKYVDDENLSEGKQEVYINGRTGYRAESERVYYKNSQEIKREALPSSYYDAIATVIKVGRKK